MAPRRAGAGRRCLLIGTAILLAACSTGPTPPNKPSGGRNEIRSPADAVAEVPEVVVGGPSGAGQPARPASYAYVSESNSIVLFDPAGSRLAPDVELDAVPQEIGAGNGTLVLGFASGELAAVDVVTRRQVARASLSALRGRALGGDISLDEVLVGDDGVVVLAGRIADKETGGYRSFVQERDGRDLSLLREEVLPPALGVVQDLAAGPAGAVRFLLSDGRVYDRHTGISTDTGAGPDGQVLRYGPTGGRWVGSGDARPGVLTPDDVFVPLAAGRVSDIVPVRPGVAAVLVSQPPQVWLVSSTGDVLSRTDTDDYPYAGALVDGRLHVGSANGTRLQVLNPSSGAVERHIELGQGIVSLGALPR